VRRTNLTWGLVAAAGVGLVLLQQAVSAGPLQPRQGGGFVVLVVAVLAVALAFRWLLPSALVALRRAPDLLVPLGLLVFVEAVVGWLLLLPPLAAVLAPSTSVKVLSLSFTVSLAVVLTILLRVAYAAWMTTLVLDAVREGRADLPRSFARSWRRFGRVLALVFVGWGMLFLGLLLVITLAACAMPLALVLVGLGSLLWNLATAALLPVALGEELLRFGPALGKGIRVSWSFKGRWWKLVVVQMGLLGWVTFVSLSYTEERPGSTTTRSVTNWSVNGFWTGGYEDECRWYGKVMEALQAPGLAVVSTALTLVFGVLAVGIKLAITEDLRLPPAESWKPGPESSPWPVPPPAPGAEGDDRVQPAEGSGPVGHIRPPPAGGVY
jgi:hypothetical protein